MSTICKWFLFGIIASTAPIAIEYFYLIITSSYSSMYDLAREGKIIIIAIGIFAAAEGNLIFSKKGVFEDALSSMCTVFLLLTAAAYGISYALTRQGVILDQYIMTCMSFGTYGTAVFTSLLVAITNCRVSNG